MSNFGNLLTTASSTVWSPFQSNVNAVIKSHITASSIYYNSISYLPSFVTGSYQQETSEYGMAIGSPPQKYSYNQVIGTGWIANLGGGDTYHYLQFDLDQGTGRTEALDSFIIQSSNGSTYQAGGYEISASNNNSTWTPLTSSIYYPGGTGLSTTGYDATMLFTNTSSYRYYRITITDPQNSTFSGFNGLISWDSSLFKNQINLLNPNESNVTASFVESSNTSLERLTSPQREAFGWYYIEKIGSVDFNWDEPKLFRGLFGPGYSNGSYYPGILQFYKSETGELNDWKLFSTVNLFDTQHPTQVATNFFIDLQTPIKTQYLRMVIYGEGDDTPNSNLLMYNAWMYEMSSSQSPTIPTNLTASAFQNNVGLEWSQNSGSDNRLVDIIYNIERSSDGGSSYDPVVTLSGSIIQTSNTSSVGIPTQTNYIDSNLIDGTYLYRVQSQNQHHLTTSSFTTTTEVTVPTTSGDSSKKIYTTNKGNILINPNDTILIEL